MPNEDRPLLLFQTPSSIAVERRRRFSPPDITFPPPAVQVTRLDPQFNALQAAFERKQAELSESPVGTMPEQVLVLETIGSIHDFVKAVRAIRGMEWLAGLDQIESEPDELFHFTDEAERHKLLKGQLFLIMTNHAAMRQLLSLWDRYRQNPNMSFVRGQSKWRAVFERLKNIRAWDVEDRLNETGVLDDWRERAREGRETVTVEIEAWFKSEVADQRSGSAEIAHLITDCGGQVLAESVVNQISYHGILAKMPIGAVSEVLLGRRTKLLACDRVMFIRPGGQVVTSRQQVPESEIEWPAPTTKPWFGSPPVVALLDGLPLENHLALIDSLVVDDPDSWAENYSPAERYHGTAMCSLIVRGDLSIEQEPFERRIYVRPILKPEPEWWDTPRPEMLPGDRLIVDIVHQAVMRIFDGPNGVGVAPTVRVINFSIGDSNRHFVRFMSPLARLLDWLSWKYNVLFIVSAGNQGDDLELPIEVARFEELPPVDQQEIALHAMASSSRNRRLLSPAESVNALTVGACHSDFSAIGYLGDRMNVIHSHALPSPISAHGLGYRRSIKPEILMPGGRQLYRRRIDGSQSTTRLTIARFLSGPPGVKVAAPSQDGKLNNVVFTTGTSNATALTTRASAQLFEVLHSLRSEEGGVIDGVHYSVLLKALLVHGAEWGHAHDSIKAIAPKALDPRDNRRVFKSYASRMLGYGTVSLNRVFECTDQRATLIGGGTLGSDEGHRYLLPIPEALSGVDVQRRLSVTLAWLSPINPSHQLYRQAAMWFEFDSEPLSVARRDADWLAVRRGTIQHEIFTGAEILEVQDGQFIELFVKCRGEANLLESAIPYGLVVSIESLSDQPLPIYEQVKARIAVPIRN